jgi:hypothetical protein
MTDKKLIQTHSEDIAISPELLELAEVIVEQTEEREKSYKENPKNYDNILANFICAEDGSKTKKVP